MRSYYEIAAFVYSIIDLDLHFGVESCDHWRVVHFHSPTPWDVILSLLLEPIATLNVFDIFNPFSDLLSNPSNIIQVSCNSFN